MRTIHGCIALVTGASAGIGLELARHIAPKARTLILVARRLDHLETLKEELTRKFPDLHVIVRSLDLRDEAAVGEFLADAKQIYPPVNFLVNNAGLGDYGDFASSDWSRVKEMLDVNMGALTRLTHQLLPGMLRSQRAWILNVSSIAGFLPIPKMAVYAASKAYVTSFTEALRAELRGTGVEVTALCPGPVDTEFAAMAKRPESRDDARLFTPELIKVPAAQVAREAIAAVEYGRARHVPGVAVALLALVICLMPMFLLRLIMNQRRHSE